MGPALDKQETSIQKAVRLRAEAAALETSWKQTLDADVSVALEALAGSFTGLCEDDSPLYCLTAWLDRAVKRESWKEAILLVNALHPTIEASMIGWPDKPPGNDNDSLIALKSVERHIESKLGVDAQRRRANSRGWGYHY